MALIPKIGVNTKFFEELKVGSASFISKDCRYAQVYTRSLIR